MSNLSNRINALAESATIAMATKARELKAQGLNVISLSLGEPDFKTPENVQAAAKEAIDEGKYFSYAPVPGYPELRKAIADKFVKENPQQRPRYYFTNQPAPVPLRQQGALRFPPDRPRYFTFPYPPKATGPCIPLTRGV